MITILTFFSTFYFLWDVSTTHPGYLKLGNLSKNDFINNSNFNNYIINGYKIDLKYCETCAILREPRSFHCGLCGFCVLKHDHHCPFVGNCIGLRNFKKFMKFILLLFIHCLIVSVFGIMEFIELKNCGEEFSIDGICVIIVLIFSLLTLISLGIMIGQYIYLISNNKTTNENIRNIIYPGNVFDQGFKLNWIDFFKN